MVAGGKGGIVVVVVGQVAVVVAQAVVVVAQAAAAAVAAVSVARVHRRQHLLHLQQEVRQMPASKKAVRLVSAEQIEAETSMPESAVSESETATVETQPDMAESPRLRITLYKSGTGYKYDQKRTLAALGLTRLNMKVERPDNASVRGMLNKVQHLVRVEEIG